MKISKADNQYYAEMFEKAVNAYINNIEPVNDTGFKFSNEDLATILEDAKNCAEYM